MNTTKTAGLILGLVGFILPFFLSLPGLSYAGHIALSIFFTGGLLLDARAHTHTRYLCACYISGSAAPQRSGPLYKNAQAPLTQLNLSRTGLKFRQRQSTVTNQVWIRDNGSWRAADVEVQPSDNSNVIIRSTELSRGHADCQRNHPSQCKLQSTQVSGLCGYPGQSHYYSSFWADLCWLRERLSYSFR